LVYVNSGLGGSSYQVLRAQSGTIAATHTSSCAWYGHRWTNATFGADTGSGPVTALAFDGAKVWVAFAGGSATDNVTLWYGDTTSFSGRATTTGIVGLAYCNGLIYAIGSAGTLGYFLSGTTWEQLSAHDAVYPGTSGVAITTLGNFVYGAFSNGSRSWVYKAQHSTADTFELLADMPSGFVATSIIGHLGNLYVGGYVDTLDTHPTAGINRYQGELYMIDSGGTITPLASFGGIPGSKG
jgi:hypothetical protein